jgi:hypothetical protein
VGNKRNTLRISLYPICHKLIAILALRVIAGNLFQTGYGGVSILHAHSTAFVFIVVG